MGFGIPSTQDAREMDTSRVERLVREQVAALRDTNPNTQCIRDFSISLLQLVQYILTTDATMDGIRINFIGMTMNGT